MDSIQEYADSSGAEPVRGFLHTPSAPNGDGLVLTHSAGGNCQAPLLVAVAEAFCAAGLKVLRCDLPFRQARPHGPPIRTAERDQAGLRAAVEAMRHRLTSPNVQSRGPAAARVFLGGHSYGGRMASMLAATEPGLADALLLLSYPLHPPRQPQQLRTQHFPKLQTPALFVSGARDGFGTVAEMETALKLIPAQTRLLTVEGAGHELLSKRNGEALPGLIVEAFRDFVTAT
ncbi:MAG: alpha/beta family hydrolase [Acidobacteriaceae bacterium]|jgi:predicted alpha/beta-hydrolase family hydrolase